MWQTAAIIWQKWHLTSSAFKSFNFFCITVNQILRRPKICPPYNPQEYSPIFLRLNQLQLFQKHSTHHFLSAKMTLLISLELLHAEEMTQQLFLIMLRLMYVMLPNTKKTRSIHFSVHHEETTWNYDYSVSFCSKHLFFSMIWMLGLQPSTL